jgi:hypothetical protein
VLQDAVIKCLRIRDQDGGLGTQQTQRNREGIAVSSGFIGEQNRRSNHEVSISERL